MSTLSKSTALAVLVTYVIYIMFGHGFALPSFLDVSDGLIQDQSKYQQYNTKAN